ncbi:MAG TPA: bifunctional adenosylcobinamide kinase/adenosylcobinamide-phosphate guanylyltransferase [Epulopiscium sp.]|nr:bifunctional adenosylcobinamide kinase/adenosylcobinamide-phosphate guanylyltransferase [Candidatus Epulonipiscium sp.]
MSSNIILITGGSRSGKSSYAEKLYSHTNEVLYIATAIVTDKEMQDRINLHKQSRNQNWETAEQYKGLDQIVANTSKKNILLDCVTVMVTNLMFDQETNEEKVNIQDLSLAALEVLEQNIIKEFRKLTKEVRARDKNIILVTNEVGYGLVPDYKLGRIFRDIAGRVNQQLALLSDEVYLVSCGLPLKLK